MPLCHYAWLQLLCLCNFSPQKVAASLTHWGWDKIFKYIFLNENSQNWLKISLMFIPKVPINNIPALV